MPWFSDEFKRKWHVITHHGILRHLGLFSSGGRIGTWWVKPGRVYANGFCCVTCGHVNAKYVRAQRPELALYPHAESTVDGTTVPWMYEDELAWKLGHSKEEPGHDLFSAHIASSTTDSEDGFVSRTK